MGNSSSVALVTPGASEVQAAFSLGPISRDSVKYFMPSEMYGFADALAAGNGTPAAPAPLAGEGSEAPNPGIDEFSWVYEPASSATGPRSPIMHLGRRPNKRG